jgi:hypothetical protein
LTGAQASSLAGIRDPLTASGTLALPVSTPNYFTFTSGTADMPGANWCCESI